MTNALLIAQAQRLDAALNAFVAFSTSTAKPGKLKRWTYAAKDIFAAPDRRPCGGLSAPLPPMDSRYADVLRRLDMAGAARPRRHAPPAHAPQPPRQNTADRRRGE